MLKLRAKCNYLRCIKLEKSAHLILRMNAVMGETRQDKRSLYM